MDAALGLTDSRNPIHGLEVVAWTDPATGNHCPTLCRAGDDVLVMKVDDVLAAASALMAVLADRAASGMVGMSGT